MSQIDVMKNEIKKMEEVKLQVLQRMIQVQGDLYEYSPFLDDNILRAKEVFLCIDQTGQYEYQINITDMAGSLSYTRKYITNSSDFQMSMKDRALNFLGNPRPESRFIPGYVFLIKNVLDFQNLKGVLAKCFFESSNKQNYEKALAEGDNKYLEQQLETDVAREDVNMNEIDAEIDDFEFQDALNKAGSSSNSSS